MTHTRTIELAFEHRVAFTRDVLEVNNPTLADCLEGAKPDMNESASEDPDRPPSVYQTGRSSLRPPPQVRLSLAHVLAFVDTGVAAAFPDLPKRLRHYARAHRDCMELVGRVQPVVGGEACKNDRDAVYRILNAIDAAHLDRQSYVLAIGGGAVLDCVGFAAAIAHRGLRVIRMPTTTLAQADSGVGVKNGINGFGKKNFLGTFAVPWAVINDERFLTTLSDRDWRAGFSEAVKVALLKDAALFERIERDAAVIAKPAYASGSELGRVSSRDLAVAMPIVERSACLHLDHIASAGDPFELTHARPLDFGHWAAHKLEQMTDFELRHGEAVAIGLALDVTYAAHVGLLDSAVAQRIRQCLTRLDFELYHEAIADLQGLLVGLEEFREHLGGGLAITLLRDIAVPMEVHEVDAAAMVEAVKQLRHTSRIHGSSVAPAAR